VLRGRKPKRGLEPSGGDGAIAQAMRRRWPDIQLDIVELDPWRASLLRKGGWGEVHEANFLEWKPPHGEPYDVIVMNPPFTSDGDKLAYVTHIERALELLAVGSPLAAIVPGGFTYVKDSRVSTLRLFVNEHGDWDELPSDMFKESGTMLSTVLIKLLKPEPKTHDLSHPEVRGLLSLPTSKSEFKDLLKSASLESLEAADHLIDQDASGGKTRSKAVQSRLKALRKEIADEQFDQRRDENLKRQNEYVKRIFEPLMQTEEWQQLRQQVDISDEDMERQIKRELAKLKPYKVGDTWWRAQDGKLLTDAGEVKSLTLVVRETFDIPYINNWNQHWLDTGDSEFKRMANKAKLLRMILPLYPEVEAEESRRLNPIIMLSSTLKKLREGGHVPSELEAEVDVAIAMAEPYHF
ncbi:MAG TPA: hypothetical protein V6D29_09435, partial [Leptolyngbyaceae cyanobacterium]